MTGAARNCLESAIDYATTREQFGKPIASFQLTQAKLSWMAADLYRSQLLALHLGRLKEAGPASPVQVSIAKMTNVRSAIDIARQARTVLGASGVTLEYPPDQAREQPGSGADLRGHRGDPHAGHRPGAHRHLRVSLASATRPGREVGTLRLERRRLSRRGGALAQWQSSGLLTHWFRVRPPGAPPVKTLLSILVPWTGSWTDVSGPVYRRVMARGPAGHIERLPSGSWRVKVYAGTDPLTGREIRLRKTCKTERAAQIELGKLLEQAAAGRQPETNATVAELMDRYAEIADWDLSTRKANEIYIRRVIKPALGHLQVRKIRGPLLDLLYAQLRRCGDPACTGKSFTEHRNVPVLAVNPASRQPAWQQVADAIGNAIRSGQCSPRVEPLPSVRETSDLQDVPVATLQHALAVLAAEGLIVVRQGRPRSWRVTSAPERRTARPQRGRDHDCRRAGCKPHCQAADGEDDPEHPQHLVRRLLHGGTLGMDRLEPRCVGQAARPSRGGRSWPPRLETSPR